MKKQLYIYFIRCGHFVKIGKSVNPDYRLSQLGQGHPHMRIVGLIRADSAAQEAALHRQFAKHRTSGEWFVFHRDIKEYVELHATEDHWQRRRDAAYEKNKDWGLENLTPEKRKAFDREYREVQLEYERETQREIEADKAWKRAWRDAAGNGR